MAPSATAKTVTACITGANSNYALSSLNPTTPLIITPENAQITFTGTQLVATQSASSSLATVTLRATVQDITATTDAAGDTSFGDIRNAKVRFLNSNVPIVTGSTDANGWISGGIGNIKLAT
jgi:hypothetical protein